MSTRCPGKHRPSQKLMEAKRGPLTQGRRAKWKSLKTRRAHKREWVWRNSVARHSTCPGENEQFTSARTLTTLLNSRRVTINQQARLPITNHHVVSKSCLTSSASANVRLSYITYKNHAASTALGKQRCRKPDTSQANIGAASYSTAHRA
jgi:hypothetical protein